MKRKEMIFVFGLMAGITALAAPASSSSCYDLWYERNSIYDHDGFCFSKKLGKQTFDNSDCWTKKSEPEQVGAAPGGTDEGRGAPPRLQGQQVANRSEPFSVCTIRPLFVRAANAPLSQSGLSVHVKTYQG